VLETLSSWRHLDLHQRYLNRELSALDFDARVLELAADPALPLLERVRFLSIVSSNLDEFFMVRVAGLVNQLDVAGIRSADGRTPAETLVELRPRIARLVRRQSRLWLDELQPALADDGITVAAFDELSSPQRDLFERWFAAEVFPILTPLAVGPGQPFPYISGLSLSLGLLVQRPGSSEVRLARVKVPEGLRRLVTLRERTHQQTPFVPLEQIIAAFIDALFPGTAVIDCAPFRVTRDADFEISDDADDLLAAVKSELKSRRFGEVVRLEIGADAGEELISRLQAGLGISERETYRIEGPLDLAKLSELASLERPELSYPRWQPVIPPALQTETHAFLAAIRASDVLVQHPYDSFAGSVEKFLAAAAYGERTVALKTTVYRTNEQSPLGPALSAAAEAGKQAVCLVELKARFDERHNIAWGRRLEESGVHVVYGFPDLKVHAKLTLIVSREDDGLRRYAHIGTGNYHALTANLYEDFGLFTSDPEITADVADLFNYLTGYGDEPSFRKLAVAPWALRSRILGEIERVAEAAADGQRALIRLKVNALVDDAVIDALYDASSRGVQIEIVARSICCLRPGVQGMSENITVRSVLGRFLEHSRFYMFRAGEATTVLLGSADLMPRNLDRRIEVLTPIEAKAAKHELKHAFKTLMSDTQNAWELQPDGSWRRHRPDDEQPPQSSQVAQMGRALERTQLAGSTP
jgi:polyphosphate kinase